MIERSENRSCYRLVGLNHELEFWPNPHIVCPPLDDEWEREYDPADLFDSEKWITSVRQFNLSSCYNLLLHPFSEVCRVLTG